MTELREVGPPPPRAPLEEPPPERELWPWLLVLLVLVLAGLGAAWFAVHESKSKTTVTTVTVPAARPSRPAGTPPMPVPDLVGQKREDAVKALDAIGLKANVVEVPSAEPKNSVVAQHPPGGATVAGSGAVRLNVSAGQPKPATAQRPELPGAAAAVTVPDVAGMKLGKARKEIRKAGLVAEIRRVPSDLHEDTVVSQSPPAGTGATRGDHIFVTVASEAEG